MMVHYNGSSMVIITTFIQCVFIILFGFTAIGLLLYSIWIWEYPGSFAFGGTAIIVLLMLGTVWFSDPRRSFPGW